MGDDTTRRTLYVGNLPDDITTKELNDEFRHFGRIVR
jgi:RNA recognition motif-containing protein